MIQRTEQEIMKNWGDYDVPTLSICSITYNHENYISQALDSFLMQETDFPFEIIIRDDCSPDKTADIIREYVEKYPRIVKPIYEKENQYSQGKPGMIVVFKKALGEYIAICEGDDFWTDKHKLQKQVDFLKNNSDYNGCFHDSTVFIESNGEIEKSYLRIGEREIDNDVDLCSIINENNISTASIVYRNNIKEEPRFRKESSKGDYSIMVMVATNGLIKYIPENMSSYRIHAGGVWSSKGKVYQEEEALKFYFLLKEHFNNDKNVLESIFKKIKLTYYNFSIIYIRDKKILKSFYYLFLSFSFRYTHKSINYKKYLKEFTKSLIR